ncbi:MAG: LPS export ABC transporter permease LptG [Methylococcales bacterium]|nr:LPS export ABC transporter permease LptG [Methylococcales bacterium]
MNVLTGYIVKEVLKGSIIAMLLLVTLFNLFTFSDELKNLGHAHYGMEQILKFLALTTPTLFYEVIPTSALLGSLAVVVGMANNREILAMRAAGLSTAWIIRRIMLAGVFMLTLSVLVGEFIAPSMERDAQLLKSTALNDKVAMRSKYGMWLREGNNFINVRNILDDGSLSDVRIYRIDDHHNLEQITDADHARFLGDRHWELENVRHSLFSPQRITADFVPEETWQSGIDSDLLKVAVVSADNQSLYDLYTYINFLKQNNQKSQRYEVAFWSRLVNPLVTFVMLLVSAPLVIGIGRGSSTGERILVGIVIGELFDAVDKMVGHAGLIYDLNPVLVAILPSSLVLCVALYALRKSG